MTTPNHLTPEGPVTQYGSWGEVQDRTEEQWKTQQYNQWASAMAGIPKIGDKLEQIPVIGGMLSDFFEIVTGIPDSDENDAGSFIVNFFSGIRNSLNGGANPSPENSLISAVFGLLRGVNTKTNQTANLVSTGVNGQVVSQGVIDGLQYQLQVFTANGTFTPPTPPAGKQIAYFIGTAYGGGGSGDRVGDVVGAVGRGGVAGRRVSRRITVAEMGSSQTVTVGAGGAAVTAPGTGNRGRPSSIGSLLASDSGAAGVPTPYGDLPSAGAPGDGGDGGVKVVSNVSTSGSTTSARYDWTNGERGRDGGGFAGDGGIMATSWGGAARDPQAGEAGAIVGDHTTGGGGGGGGAAAAVGAFNAARCQPGAAGGAPGGGNGATGAGGGGAVAALPGPRGQVDVLTVFKETE